MLKKNSFWVKLSFSAFLLFNVGCSKNNSIEEKYNRYEISGYTQGTTYQISYIDSTDRSKLIHQKIDSTSQWGGRTA